MASEFATRLLETASARHGSVHNAKMAIDSELAEVRAALDHLLKIASDAKLPTCPACKSARTIHDKLKTD